MVSPWKRAWPFIFSNLNFIHLRLFCAKFGWNWPRRRQKCEKITTTTTTTTTTTDNRQILIRKAFQTKAPVTLDRIEPSNVKWIRIFYIQWCSSIFVLCPFYVGNIRFIPVMCSLCPSASVGNFCACKKNETDDNEQEYPLVVLCMSVLSCISPVIVRNSFVRCTGVIRCSVCRWNLSVYATRKRTFNGQTQDTCRIYIRQGELTTELKNWIKTHRTDDYRIPIG